MSLDTWSRSNSYRAKDDNSKYDKKHRDRRYEHHDDQNYNDQRDRRHRESKDVRQSDRDRYASSSSHYDREGRKQRERDRRSKRHRSHSRSSSKSRKYNRQSRSTSRDRRRRKSISRERKHVRIVRASRSRSKSRNKTPQKEGWNEANSRNGYFDLFKNDKNIGTIINLDENFDKEKIHKEMQERLTQHLAREGKIYPPPKPQASHPIFANDGSFLETFKKLQEQQKQQELDKYEVEKKAPQPLFGKRRGGKILKTGIVQKPKSLDTNSEDNPNDAWAIYLQEVKKYKNVSCDADSKTRPLVK